MSFFICQDTQAVKPVPQGCVYNWLLRLGRTPGCVWVLLLAGSSHLLADGGMVLQHVEKAPFVLTVFVSPTPSRVGLIDVSVLVQSGETLEPVLNADVVIALTKGDSRIEARATRDQAQNKLLYAASVRLNDPGEWRYTVSINRAVVSGLMSVAPEQPKLAAYWSYLALPFPVIALFALNQFLERRHKELFHGPETGLLAHHD